MRSAFIAAVAAVFLSFSPVFSQAADVTCLAVPDFKNLSKNAGYDFLSRSISESITTTLQKSGKLKLVERSLLSSVIEEQKLALSGMVDEDIAAGKRIGALVQADSLVLGSYTVIGDQVEVNARLVRVETGEVLLAERITEKIGDNLFAKIQELGENMVNRLLDVKTGFLDLDTTPQGATVKAGDILLGVTPIAGKKLAVGPRQLTIVLEGYEMRTVSVDIREGRNSYNFQLEKKSDLLPSKFSIYSHFLQVYGTNIQPDWGVSYEYLWNGLSFGVEYGGLSYIYSYADATAPGEVFRETQVVYYHKLDAIFKYNLFSDNRWISPYAGAAIGIALAYSDVYDIFDTRFYYKALLGVTLFPMGNYSVFIEALYHNPGQVTVKEKKFNLFGSYTLTETAVSMENFLFGAGIRYAF